MFEHIRVRKRLSAYVDGELPASEKELVERHIKTCNPCKKALQDYLELSLALKKWKDEEATADLVLKIRKEFPITLPEKESAMKKSWISVAAGSGVLVMVLAAFFATQLYVHRGLEGRMRESADKIGTQYAATATETVTQSPSEPYYLSANFRSKESTSTVLMEQMVTADVVNGACLFMAPGMPKDFSTEEYGRIYESDFLAAAENPLSTFSADVDTASYANIRRYLNGNALPPQDAVRIEEMINYFTYDYPQPQGDVPFSVTTEVAACPWNTAHEVVLVGLQGRRTDMKDLPPSNLVFLIDVSGSMEDPNKLPLLKAAFKLLVNNLRSEDSISIVTYAGNAGVVLEGVTGDHKAKIKAAIDNLEAGGCTAGHAGIEAAYRLAKANFRKDGNNRVILATDGDFNIGISDTGSLIRTIEEKRADGIFLTVLGFGTGNYKDNRMEQLADKGNGNVAYIDNLMEAKKVFVNELGATLFTIAKDVKIQVEFNPAKVKAYRLVGYENRMLKKEDFNDDKKDAGEIGAGHSVTALYEIVPAGSTEEFGKVDALKYQTQSVTQSDDLLTVKLRYKDPDKDESRLLTQPLKADVAANPSENYRFATAVAEFGLILRDSQYKGSASYDHVLTQGGSARGKDEFGYRAEFLNLVEMARMLDSHK